LISGPIERVGTIIHQLKNRSSLDIELFVSGIRLFFWGLFKKTVIADRLGMYVALVFGNPGDIYGKTAIIGIWMYSLQIFCDFSSYMDMAIGCGKIFGIELSRNFYHPYMANSISEFWHRWHITLTSWFRDYVYIPLGGKRVSELRWAVNIMTVFIVSGLWHGAAWTFIVWGMIHGILYLAEKYSEPLRGGIKKHLRIHGLFETILRILITFQLVSLAWVFFRSRTIYDALLLIKHIPMNLSMPVRMLSSQFSTVLAFFFAIVFVGIEIIDYYAERKGIDLVKSMPLVIRYPVYAAGMLIIVLFSVSSNEFIYFQF
jgi:D-alanyl-lipoteichoic acid acyltransferase DltB (MBOAT superfamily)